MTSFGEFIAKRRKQLDLTQKQIAAGIKQDDGKPISVQYLNDIEHGRRGAPPDYVIVQLAKLLRLDLDVLYFRSGRLPPDIRKRTVSDQQAAAAYRALRRQLRRSKKS
jgi:transcriptional regulator with XRE-family HTH domain